jgi:hypothetical protein
VCGSSRRTEDVPKEIVRNDTLCCEGAICNLTANVWCVRNGFGSLRNEPDTGVLEVALGPYVMSQILVC